MTTIKNNAALDDMVAQVRNRRNAPATVPATATATNAAPELSGSVEQAKEIVTRARDLMSERASRLRAIAVALNDEAAALEDEASHLDYGMDLVFSTFTPGPKPVNVDDARKRAEAEADARHAKIETITHTEVIHAREAADHETIKEMLAAAPPILARQVVDYTATGERVVLEPQKVDGAFGWTCPDHGQVVTKFSQRNKRDYLACPVDGCAEIERRA